MSQAFAIDELQPVLFVLEDFSQLLDALDEMRRRMGRPG